MLEVVLEVVLEEVVGERGEVLHAHLLRGVGSLQNARMRASAAAHMRGRVKSGSRRGPGRARALSDTSNACARATPRPRAPGIARGDAAFPLCLIHVHESE